LAVVAVDHRGQYESPARDSYGLDAWADDLRTVARTLEPPVHLIGHSLGGLIAGRAAREYDWGSVTLLNSGSGPIHQSQRDRLRMLLAALDHLTMEELWDAKAAADASFGTVPNPPDIERFLRTRFLATDPAGLRVMAQILLDGPLQDLRQARGQILVAFGVDDADSWSWQTQVDLAQRFRTRLATIPGAAHSPAVENPQATAGLLAGLYSREGHPCVKRARYGYAPSMLIMTPLDCDPAAIRRARKTVSDQLRAWGLSAITDDAELITSELVTNAISHGGGLIELRLTCLPDRVRISVLDNDTSGTPQVAGQRGLEIGGRGLALIETIALDWGYLPTDGGKEVWAELPI
jgi:pimeloyl-ACP methyl ester carboxylesterase/anti-sigma regulatory factor (Ser/Thr protein kinase)